MNRVLLGGCILLTSSAFTVRAQELKLKHGSVCWPLHISGITLGETNDSEVLRLLGKGLERTGQVETAGRFFTNKGHTATLHVISYTDEVVGEVTLRAGIDPSIHTSELKQAESEWFNATEGFGNWHALHLGSSRDDVAKNLSEPKKRIAVNDWRYETICECELPEYFDIFFKENKVTKVVFSAPPG